MKLVQAWERSGQSASRFAASRDISPKTLYWWRWRLGSRGAKVPGRSRKRAPEKQSTPRLVHVKVDESRSEAPDQVAWELETNAVVLRVHTAIPPHELDRVLVAMTGEQDSP